MNDLIETGSRAFCITTHAVGSASFEAQACGSSAARWTVGLATMLTLALFLIVAVTSLAARVR